MSYSSQLNLSGNRKYIGTVQARSRLEVAHGNLHDASMTVIAWVKTGILISISCAKRDDILSSGDFVSGVDDYFCMFP